MPKKVNRAVTAKWGDSCESKVSPKGTTFELTHLSCNNFMSNRANPLRAGYEDRVEWLERTVKSVASEDKVAALEEVLVGHEVILRAANSEPRLN